MRRSLRLLPYFYSATAAVQLLNELSVGLVPNGVDLSFQAAHFLSLNFLSGPIGQKN